MPSGDKLSEFRFYATLAGCATWVIISLLWALQRHLLMGIMRMPLSLGCFEAYVRTTYKHRSWRLAHRQCSWILTVPIYITVLYELVRDQVTHD